MKMTTSNGERPFKRYAASFHQDADAAVSIIRPTDIMKFMFHSETNLANTDYRKTGP